MNDNRPNILYMVCHDLGRTLGCYGKPVTSPNLDRFANQGALFTTAFCSSPACSPSRGCAMTGQTAHTNGLMGLVNRGWSMPESTRTIVDYLNDAGYLTAHFGLQHEQHSAAANRYQVEGYRQRSDLYAENAVDQAIEFLEVHKNTSRPFYLNVGTLEVHCSQWQGKLDNGERLSVYGTEALDRVYVPRVFPDVPQVRREMAKFQGAIRFLDGQFGRLMAAVDGAGLADNTIVVFTTDHGMAGMRAKMTLYDLGVENALMIRLPGRIAAGQRIDDLVANIDLMPTLLEAAGAEIPPQVQGRSFWGRITGGSAVDSRSEIFTERNYHGGVISHYDPMRAVRTDRYHYIRNFGDDPREYWLPQDVPYMNEDYADWWDYLWPQPALPRSREELFDVVADPDEFTNLADDPGYAQIKADLASKLEHWMEETADPLLRGDIPDKLHGWPEKP